MSDDLVERLLAKDIDDDDPSSVVFATHINPDGPEAAELIRALTAERDRLAAENEGLEAQIAAIEEDGTQEHNEAIRLRGENARLREGLLDSSASLAAAISLLERGGKRAAPSNKMFDQMLKDYQSSLERARALLNKEPTDAFNAN